MLHSTDDTLNAFRALYPAMPADDVPAAYERFRRYVQVAVDIAESDGRDELTVFEAGGTVFTGQVDPTRTFTITG